MFKPDHTDSPAIASWRIGLCMLAALWLGSAAVSSRGVQAAAPQQAARAAAAAAPAGHGATFTRYCVSCHSQAMKQRGTVPVALDNLDIANVSAHPDVWEKVVLKMRAGVMPP